MSVPSLSAELGRIDEPQVADEYRAVLSQVAAARRPVIVRRSGHDLVAVVPLEHLEFISDGLARQKVEEAASRIAWQRLPDSLRPPQTWFDDEEDNPFEPKPKPLS
jgi:hypothetical protein